MWQLVGMKVILPQVFLLVGYFCSQSQCQLSASDQEELLFAHNYFRSFVEPTATNMQRMVWNDELATIAQNYADGCFLASNNNRVSQADSFTSVGENRAATASFVNYTELVRMSWHDPGQSLYNFVNNTCGGSPGDCDFYTQIVWATSVALGCGATDCPTLTNFPATNSLFLVCNYAPSGNFPSIRPYEEGDPCSQCPQDFCVSRLCSNTFDAIPGLPPTAPIVSIEAVPVTEPSDGDATVTSAILTLYLHNTTALTGDVVVELVAIAGTATEDTDFIQPSSFLVTFDSNALDGATVNVSVLIVDDSLVEEEESFQLSIVNITSSDMVLASGPENVTVNITDSDIAVVSVEDVSTTIDEASGDTVVATIRLSTESESATLGQDVIVMVSSPTGIGSDFLFTTSPMHTFFAGMPANNMSNINIRSIDDDLLEGPEEFTLSIQVISGPATVIPGNDSINVTITDNENGNVTLQEVLPQSEGNDASVVVELSSVIGLERPMTVYLSLTTDGSASESDFTVMMPFTVEIPAGMSAPSASILISLIVDNIFENDEVFSVAIISTSLPENVQIGIPSSAEVTILDNDASAVIVEMVSPSQDVSETAGSVSVCLEITQLPVGRADDNLNLTMSLIVSPLTAEAGYDYEEQANLTAVFYGPLTTNAPVCIDIAIINDTILESDEEFLVELVSSTPSGVTIPPSGNSTIVTIGDDESDNGIVMVTADARTRENDQEDLTVCARIDGVSGSEIVATVDLMFIDSTLAVLGEDFLSDSTTLVFNQTIEACTNVSISDDVNYEGDHQFTVQLNSASTYPSTLQVLPSDDTEVVFTITDADDVIVNLVPLWPADFREPNVEALLSVFVRMTLAAGGMLQTDFNATVSTQDGTATAPEDYTALSNYTVSFPSMSPSDFMASINDLTIQPDMLLEGDESFTVLLEESPMLYTVGSTSSVEVTITDEDDLQAFHFNLVPVESPTEGTDTTAEVCAVASFTLTGLSIPVTIDIVAEDGSLAVRGDDYTLPQSLQYTFNTSTMSGDRLCLEFGILNDDNYEGDHSFIVSVSPPTLPPGITIGTDSEEVIIEDDDVLVQMMSMDMTTNENDRSTLMICAVAPGVNMFEIQAAVIMDIMGDNLTMPTMDFFEPGGRMAIFAMGQADSACINIIVRNDDDFEGDHQFTVTVRNPSPSTQRLMVDPNDDSITVTITDMDDATVTLSDASLAGDEGEIVALCATLTIAGMLQVPISVTFGLQDNTTSPTDYDLVNGLTATIDAGSNSTAEACVNISLLTDSILEADQVLYATIENTSPPTVINSSMISITIGDGNLQDASVAFTSNEYTGAEGSSVMPCVALTDLPDGGSEVEIEVSVSANNDSAVLGSDYETVGSTSVTFPPGSFAQLVNDERCVEVSLIQDDALEGTQSFSLHLATVPDIVIDVLYSSVNIQDTDTAVVGFVQPAMYSAVEGQPDPVEVCLEISSIPANGLETNVVVTLSTVNGLKTVQGADFTLPNMFQVEFPSTSVNGDEECANIIIVNDAELEGDEQIFTVEIMSIIPSNVVSDAAADEAIVTIADDDADDAAVRFSMSQINAMEGQSTTTVTQICLTMDDIPIGGVSCPVTVTLATRASDGLKEAFEGEDFELVEPFEVVFEAGSSDGDELCAAVSIIDDGMLEGPHGFEVYVESTDPPIIVRSTGNSTVVTISDNDVGEVRLTGTMQYVLYEGQQESISVCVEVTDFSGGLECAITTYFEPQSLTAMQNEDYENFNLTIEIPAATPLNTPVCVDDVMIPVVDDMILEDVQSFNLEMISATINGYVVNIGAQSSIEIQIVDNNNATVGLTDTSYYGTENETVVVCVVLSDVPSGGSQRDIEVSLSLSNSVAVLDEDYALPDSLTVTFQPGNFASLNYSQECIDIPLLSDTAIEGDHSFYVNLLSTIPSLELGSTAASVTIRDINVAAVRLVPIITAFEPAHLTTSITVTVRLELQGDDELAINITVPLTTINGTAVSPDDFSEVTSPFQVVFPVGSVDGTSRGVSINIHPDSALEGDHHFNVSLLESPQYVLEEPSNIAITIEDERTTSAFLQLRLGPVENCTRWIADNPAQKMVDIREAIADSTRQQCFCNFTQANIINGQFNCQNLATEVVFTAEIVFSTVSTLNYGASNLLVLVTLWASRSSPLQVSGAVLMTDPTCPTRSGSLTSDDCIPPPVSDSLNAGEIVGIVIGVLILLVIIIAVVIIILVIVAKKRSASAYSFDPPRALPRKKMRVEDDVVLPNVNLYVVEDSGEVEVVEGKV